jgi:hypothetical protein
MHLNALYTLTDLVDERKNPRNYQVFLLFLFSLLMGLALASSATSQSVSVAGVPLPPLCLFHLATGLDCPACGITRALVLAFHGRWLESYLMHLWGLPLALLVAAQIPYRLYRISGGRPPAVSRRSRLWTTRIVVVSLLLPWIARLTIRFIG